MKEKLQSFGKAMLVPIALVALGGLLLGLGGALTNETTITAFGVDWASYKESFLFTIFLVIKGLGDAIFKILSLLYGVGVAFSLAKKEKGWAAFSAVIAFLAMLTTIQIILAADGITAATASRSALEAAGMSAAEAAKTAGLYKTELGYFTYSSGVFGGIALGSMVAYLHNKFYKTKLPVALSFFSGTRTVPIVCLLAGGVLGIVISFIWPTVGGMFHNIADFISRSGLLGTFTYAVTKESLVPFGMHPLVSTPMRWTELGGSMMIDGELVVGQSAIQLAQLGSNEAGKLLVRSFMGGSAVINFGIFPGAALAIYHCAKPENRKKVAGLLIPTIVATTCFGITEPILFTFLFVAPWLYFLVHVPMSAIAEVLCEFFQVSIFQGNIKDWIPFFLRPEKLNIVPLLFLIPAFFALAYFVFKFLIKLKNVQTPGREDDITSEDDIKLYYRKDYEAKNEEKKSNKKAKAEVGLELARGIVEALGGPENIVEVDNCISRLRVVLVDGTKTAEDDVWKKQLQAMGVVRLGNAIQIIYGAHVASVAVDVREVLDI